MKVLIDTHVHIYPFHRIETALAALLDNMAAKDPDAVRMACLTERDDCDAFGAMAGDAREATAGRFEGRAISPRILELMETETGRRLYLVSGRQIVTRENIEVLGINITARIPGGLSAEETVTRVLEAGGVPVLAWAPGKWFAGRGRVVRGVLERFAPHQVALGDTSLRPRGWGTPFIMRAARAKGFRVFSGSDPLPFAGEEQRAGSLYTEISDIDTEPREIPGRLLELPAGSIHQGGVRALPGVVARRLLMHKRASSRPDS